MRFVREDSEVSIKVMQIIARMNVGGPAVIVADLMRGLKPEKFNQILVTGFCDDDEADYLETVARDVSATRIAGLGRSISLVADLRAFFALVAMIKREQPDVIHTHTAKAGVLGRVASIVAGAKAVRVHTFHGHLLHGYFTGWKTALVIAIEKYLAKRTHFLIAVGNQVRDDLLAVGIGTQAKFCTFFPGLPAPHTPSKAQCRNELGLDASTIYCTFVGRLTQIKRPDRLLDIAQLMKQKRINVQFLIAGEGDLFQASLERVKSEGLPVTFLGWRNDIDLIFAASDIAILTSDNEGIPLTLIQAAQAGLAIVAPRVGSIADIVVDGENGFLTSTDPAEMADSLARLVNDKALREKLGVSGRERATELFSLAKSLDDHAKLYEFSQHK